MMSISTAALMKGIVSAWNDSTLDATFKALWSSASSEFFVLLDQEAPGGQPLPYCVLDAMGSNTRERMSGAATLIKRETRDVVVRFNIHTRDITSDTRTMKEIAAFLAAEIMKVFGGHPTQSPTGTIALDSGNHLITQYQNDYGVKTGDDEYQWIIDYLFRIDMPVAV